MQSGKGVKETVLAVITDICPDARRMKVAETMSLNGDLSMDSLDITECVMALEKIYGIHVDDRRIVKMKTVGDIINTVSVYL